MIWLLMPSSHGYNKITQLYNTAYWSGDISEMRKRNNSLQHTTSWGGATCFLSINPSHDLLFVLLN